MNKILVTGSCGFIGMHLCEKLIKSGYCVHGIDNLNNYYDRKLKFARLSKLKSLGNFTFKRLDISHKNRLEETFKAYQPSKVVHLAAQAGVRYSLINPQAYVRSNILGFINVLDICRKTDVEGLIYASSSSVYGGNKAIPFSVKDRVDNPLSIYAVSKTSNEQMAKAYHHLYKLKVTGLRFFTVYGPWGRPDMAIYIFTENILKRKPIPIFNFGRMKRDFTYIDDIVNGVCSSIEKNYECEIFNLGNNNSEDLNKVINIIEKELGLNAKYNFTGPQPGDVIATKADIEKSKKMLGYLPKTKISEGIPKFIKWYKQYISV